MLVHAGVLGDVVPVFLSTKRHLATAEAPRNDNLSLECKLDSLDTRAKLPVMCARADRYKEASTSFILISNRTSHVLTPVGRAVGSTTAEQGWAR